MSEVPGTMTVIKENELSIPGLNEGNGLIDYKGGTSIRSNETNMRRHTMCHFYLTFNQTQHQQHKCGNAGGRTSVVLGYSA